MSGADGAALTVIAAGVATSVRDGGRRGLAHLGRSRGGAVDLDALHGANRLVGNVPDAAALETSGGAVVRAERAVTVAVAGSAVDVHVEHGPPLGWGVPVAVPAGAVVRVGRLHGGARAYLAVRGGIVASGSATDLAVGPEPDEPVPAAIGVPVPVDRPVRVWPGPRREWFVADAWPQLLAGEWRVRAHSDRVGLRLDGPELRRRTRDELAPEGLVEGAIQVPPDGQPIVMLADHPTTGGYPVLAVVDPADLSVVAQRPPGSTVRFVVAR